ncbi:MAG: hypothetical protein NTW60_01225, partial [Candidatus Wolfebacteria bacterium]|nr:hypothetical protein [Candidatus Wolfebacteria bacterium]
PYHTYYDSSAPCTSANGKYIASTPDGYPIAYISHNTALTYCQSLGAHLLTNDEYMTIARNAEQVSGNWSGGSPGSGYMYPGHNDNAPAYALIADTNDANGYFGETNQGGNQRRTLTLSNGSVIWDMAGNVYQHVQRSVNNAGDNTNTITTPTCSSGATWCEYAGAGAHITAWNDASFSAATVGPSNGSWYSSQGMGQVYPATGANSGTVFFRGGNWNNGTYGGVFTLFLTWGTGNAGDYVGFRCAR